VLLSVLDRKWREHLYEMDYLKEGIGLRAVAQRDPVIEYQREGYDMFVAMLDALKEESVGFLFNLQVEAAEPPADAQPAAAEQLPAVLGNGKPSPRPRTPSPAPREPESDVPPALRGKGLGGQEEQHLTFSGPSEGGGVQSRGTGNGQPDGQAGGTRRDRRAAARANAKGGKRPKR
jgi:preprotein translocase subunit SecA